MENIFAGAEDVIMHISGNVATISFPAQPGNSGRDGGLTNARSSKTVSIQSLMKSFKSFVSSTASPVLPTNCVKYKESGSYIHLACFHPSERFDAILQGGSRGSRGELRFENCVRPAMIMVYKIGVRGDGQYTLHETHAYAVKETDALLISNKTELYRPPFPNINDAGGVCWGSANISNGSELQSLTGLRLYANRLFSAPFNSDLFNATLMAEYAINRPADLFEMLQKEETFPEKLLLKLHTKKTLGGI